MHSHNKTSRWREHNEKGNTGRRESSRHPSNTRRARRSLSYMLETIEKMHSDHLAGLDRSFNEAIALLRSNPRTPSSVDNIESYLQHFTSTSEHTSARREHWFLLALDDARIASRTDQRLECDFTRLIRRCDESEEFRCEWDDELELSLRRALYDASRQQPKMSSF